MIRYKPNEYFMIDENALTKTESKLFITFLQDEIERHKEAIKKCVDIMENSVEGGMCSFIECIFWYSSYKRHKKDIRETKRTIEFLKDKWRF